MGHKPYNSIPLTEVRGITPAMILVDEKTTCTCTILLVLVNW